MQQRKFTPEEQVALERLSKLMHTLGIPFYVQQIKDLDIEEDTKMPSFNYSCQPGNILKIANQDDYFYAIVLTKDRFIYFDKFANMKGYLSDLTENIPFKVLEVRKPTSEDFALSNYDNMELIWKRPVEKIKRSIADIEKELGLTPGSLEIM